MSKLLTGVLRLREAGLSTIPIKANGSKAPALSAWAKYQEQLPDADELREWFGNGARPGVALICGAVSGGLEVMDFDEPPLIAEWRELVEEAAPGLLARLVQIGTPGDGLHVAYRCATITGNQKLARSADGKKTLIETRGEGGYVVTAGSPAACHPSGKLYRLLNGNLKAIPEITPAQREILFDCARSFNERIKPEKEPAQVAGPSSGLRPGDDYNARGDSRADLERNGWRYLRPGPRGELWARPGVDHTSATRFANGSLYVFSTSTPFEIEREYKPFSIRAVLDFDSDFKAAAKALAAEGYGDKRQAKRKKVDKQADATKIEADEEEAQTLSQLLIALARDNAELFHDAGGDAYLTATVGEHRETYRLGSRDSKDWLAGLLYRKTGRAASGDKITEALSVLRAIARHDSPEIETHVRIAGHKDAIYLDLCDKDWRQVKTDARGWQVIAGADSPVRFVRAKGMLALPDPARGGSIEELRDLLNLPADDADNWPMILGWLVAAFRPCNGDGFDYPLLALHGEQGSGKSTAQRILRDLIDPNKATLRAAPRDERDLAIAAAHGRIISCDNLTHISDNLSNAFCRLATGGGFATRELFTDDGEVIFDAQRPVILNGIAEVVTKSDLLDRTLLTNLPVIEPVRRWRKRILNRKFADAQPRILGALLDAVSAGLKRLDAGIEMEEWPRMSDFAEWAIACEPALGLMDGAFIAAYRRNVGRANGLAIDSSTVAQAIIGLIDESDDHNFDGTVGALLKALDARNEKNGQAPKNKNDWPATPEKLRAELKKLAPNLRRERIVITFGDRTKQGRKLTIARQVPERPSQPSHRHQGNEIKDLDGDGLGDGLDFGEFGTVTNTQAENGDGATGDGSQSDGKADRHHNRHRVTHSKQRAGDGVTVVTVIPELSTPDDPVTPAGWTAPF